MSYIYIYTIYIYVYILYICIYIYVYIYTRYILHLSQKTVPKISPSDGDGLGHDDRDLQLRHCRWPLGNGEPLKSPMDGGESPDFHGGY